MSDSGRDCLFRDDSAPERFVFDSRVAQVFDDMANRSVPMYAELHRIAVELVLQVAEAGDQVCDLGCSTGTFLTRLAREAEPLELRLTGMDSSPDMLNQARARLQNENTHSAINLLQADIEDKNLKLPSPCAAVSMILTLQFLAPDKRPALLQKIYEALRPGGILLLAEKLKAEGNICERMQTAFYHRFKERQGYSKTEIARKRNALENRLIPFSDCENRNLLSNCGFSEVECMMRWGPFALFLAVKSP